jgi:molybdopterin converting factor small subunit
MDEVFEAVIVAQDADPGFLGFDDDFVTQEEKHKSKREKRQSKQVLQELKSVLVGKQKEWEVREARAVARQNNVDKKDEDTKLTDEDHNTETEGYLSVPQSLMKTNILGK